MSIYLWPIKNIFELVKAKKYKQNYKYQWTINDMFI